MTGYDGTRWVRYVCSMPFRFTGVSHSPREWAAAFSTEYPASTHDLVTLARNTERWEAAFRKAFAAVRRDVWDDRESRLRATWESYG